MVGYRNKIFGSVAFVKIISGIPMVGYRNNDRPSPVTTPIVSDIPMVGTGTACRDYCIQAFGNQLFGDAPFQRVESPNLAGFDSNGAMPFTEPDVKDDPGLFPVGDLPDLCVPLPDQILVVVVSTVLCAFRQSCQGLPDSIFGFVRVWT